MYVEYNFHSEVLNCFNRVINCIKWSFNISRRISIILLKARGLNVACSLITLSSSLISVIKLQNSKRYGQPVNELVERSFVLC